MSLYDYVYNVLFVLCVVVCIWCNVTYTRWDNHMLVYLFYSSLGGGVFYAHVGCPSLHGCPAVDHD